MKRIAILAASGALVLTPVVGAWSAFAASDDGGARGTAQVRVDDRRHGEAEPGDDHGRHGRHHQREAEPGDDHGRHGGRHGGHHRHGGDDGPGHR